MLGDFNVIPEDNDVWSVKAMASDALMQPESRAAYARLLADGWTDALARSTRAAGCGPIWDYQAGAWQRDHGFRIDHLLLSPEAADRLVAPASTRNIAAAKRPATMPRSGSSSRLADREKRLADQARGLSCLDT